MPTGPQVVEGRSYDYHGRPNYPLRDVNGSTGGGDESAVSILQSVKEQEAQFELLTRELEAERQSVATQLEKVGDKFAKHKPSGVSDLPFPCWSGRREGRMQFVEFSTLGEISPTSPTSGSLKRRLSTRESHEYYDMCWKDIRGTEKESEEEMWRVLQERGLMNVGDTDHIPDDPAFHNQSSGEPYQTSSTTQYTSSSSMNGPSTMYNTYDGANAHHGNATQSKMVTVTKVTTTRQVQHQGGSTGSQSPLPPDGSNYYSNYSSFRPPQPGDPPQHSPHSPGGGSQRDAPTPTRFQNNYDLEPVGQPGQMPLHADSYDQLYSYREGDQGSYRSQEMGRDQQGAFAASDGYKETREFASSTVQYQSNHNYNNLDRDHYPGEGPGGGSNQHLSGSDHYGGSDRYSDRGAADRDYQNYPPDDQYGSDRLDAGQYPPPPSGADRFQDPPREQGYRDSPSFREDSSLQGAPPVDRYQGHDPYVPSPLKLSRDGLTPSPAPSSERGGPQLLGSQQRMADPYGSQLNSQQPFGSQQEPFGSQQGPFGSQQEPFGSQQEPFGSQQGPFGSQQGPFGSHQGSQPRLAYDDHQGLPEGYPEPMPPTDDQQFGLPPQPYGHEGIPRTPSVRSIDSQNRDQRWRNPDLQETIEFLSHPTTAVKANAAAYLQHLCYMDDDVKAKTRGLGGIPPLVELVNSDVPEVHKTACGALRNLSYGRANIDNKRAIKNCGGIQALIRLLRKSPDNDVRELVTGILWNLSSCEELKKPIIDEGLTVIVNSVVIPHSGWDRNTISDSRPTDIYWSTVFRNASGVLRNISSGQAYARKKLRECEGLVDSLIYIVHAAIGKSDIDNKSVENCVCVLGNLSYACQETEDPQYLEKKQQKQQKQGADKGEATGCFGGSKKKKDSSKDQKKDTSSQSQKPRTEPVSGMELLWQPEVVHIYLPLLSDCTNPETLEAAARALQNLAACDWEPSVEIRATVRKDKGLPVIVELLNLEADRVVCAAAIALRNLAIDGRNKVLIGKYAMRNLVTKLPAENKQPEYPISDQTICALEATLYEVIKKNSDFAQSLMIEGGVDRLVYIASSKGKYSPKATKFASSILQVMWNFKELHPEYKKHGYREQHFIQPRGSPGKSPTSSASNTLTRPRMDLVGGPEQQYNQNTMPPINRPPPGNTVSPGLGYPDGYASRERLPQDEIPMTTMGAQHYSNLDSGVGDQYPAQYSPHLDESRQRYSPRMEESRQHYSPHLDDSRGRYSPRLEDSRGQYSPHPDPRAQQDYGSSQPLGGYEQRSSDSYDPRDEYRTPNYPPEGQPQPQDEHREPLYAKVKKQPTRSDHSPYSQVRLDSGPPEGGADSWV